LTDWGLTTLSAHIGYIVPLKSMLQLKKLTMLCVGNAYNKPL